jgi:Flp pilus assembly pilin Flp
LRDRKLSLRGITYNLIPPPRTRAPLACRSDTEAENQFLSKTGMSRTVHPLWSRDEGQDIAEYAVILALILVLVAGTVGLVSGKARHVFSVVATDLGGRHDD